MRAILTPLLHLQRFFIPALLALLVWAVYRAIWKKDQAVGLALYLGLVVIVDGFMNTGIFLPGLSYGSIRYSEVIALFLLINRPPAGQRSATYPMVRLLVGFYFVLLLLAAFRAEPMMDGVFDFRRLIVPQIVSFVIAMRGFQTPEDHRRFFLSMLALSVIIGLFVFWDLFFDRWLLTSEMLSKPEYVTNRKHGRYGSFFLNPNYLGAFTVLVFPAGFVWAVGERGRHRLLAWVGLITLVFCLVQTQSRGPLLAFGATVPLLLFGPAGGMSRGRRIAVFVAFLAVFTAMLPGFFERASQRFEDLDQELSTQSARTRQTTWTYARRIIGDHPLEGIGLGEGQFLRVMERYGFRAEYGESSLDNPHNSYLQMALYAGVPGLIAYVVANLWLLLAAVRSITGGYAGRLAHVAFGLSVGLAGFLVVIYPDMHMFAQTVAPIYWVFFGLLLSVATARGAAAVAAVKAPVPAQADLALAAWEAIRPANKTALRDPARLRPRPSIRSVERL